MDNKIPYKMKEDKQGFSICVTQCPFGENYMLGSLGCEECPCNIETTDEYVICEKNQDGE